MEDSARAADGRMMSPLVRYAVMFTAVVDILLGLSFLFGPELGGTLWPTPVPAVLSRFIGSIVAASGVGAWVIGRRGTWAEARALFMVGLVYGAVILLMLLYHLLFLGANPIFWLYAAGDAVFLIAIVYIFWTYEFGGTTGRP